MVFSTLNYNSGLQTENRKIKGTKKPRVKLYLPGEELMLVSYTLAYVY